MNVQKEIDGESKLRTEQRGRDNLDELHTKLNRLRQVGICPIIYFMITSYAFADSMSLKWLTRLSRFGEAKQFRGRLFQVEYSVKNEQRLTIIDKVEYP